MSKAKLTSCVTHQESVEVNDLVLNDTDDLTSSVDGIREHKIAEEIKKALGQFADIFKSTEDCTRRKDETWNNTIGNKWTGKQ